jgi:uncharacterized repeat protein (TIGR02543 family)
VYTEPGGGWTNAFQNAELTASDGASGDSLGGSVAISGDTIAVGAPHHTVYGGLNRGAVYVFAKPTGGWTNASGGWDGRLQNAELTASDGAAYDRLGFSVAISGGTITAGTFFHPDGSGSRGAVYMFTQPSGGWTNALESAELTAPAGATAELGYSVAISGKTIAAGDPQNGPTGGEPGAVFLFFDKASPTITTQQRPASAPVGAAIADMATISGGDNPTGSVTFRLYDNPNGSGSPVFTDSELLVNGSATSAPYTPTTPGTYYWVATYSGDANNNAVSSGSADEPVTTKVWPTISTQQLPSSTPVGSAIADTATLSSTYNPSGTVTFNLYDNPNATGSPLFTDTEPVSIVYATSAPYTPTTPGTYYWVASYSGDANNNPATSGSADEPVTVTAASPTISTFEQPTFARVGSAIADTATVSGGYKPTGTVTFNLYDNPTASGSPLFTDTEPLSGGGATSASYTTTAAGADYWVATFNGDANNNAVSSGSADEPVAVTKAYAVAYEGNGATGGSVPVDGSSPHVYGTTVTVLGAGSLHRSGHTFDGWNTAANGSGTSYQPGATFFMPASAVRLYAHWVPNLNEELTRCNGVYGAVGEDVIVPTGATCTLIPGTHVAMSVLVQGGGTLYASGIRIGGTLSTSGATTVCGSKIGHDVRAAGGSLALGGPTCAGNTVAGNTFVTGLTHDVWVWGNKIKGGLSVKKLTGATESITGNVVGTLFVGDSGPPIEISKNHAVNAACQNNKSQTGSGNKATGTNTCPH